MKKVARLFGIMTLALAAGVVGAKAQTLTTLYNFCSIVTNESVCVDGSSPNRIIEGTDGNFYGTTALGGTNDRGTFFKITPEGSLTTLYQFSSEDGVGADVSLELGGLLYGTMLVGGTNRQGAIYTMTTDGTLTLLYQFSGTNGIADGTGPTRMMEVDDSTLIGTTILGGSNNYGTIFTITADGKLTTIHEFSGTNGVADGAEPGLTLMNGDEFIGSTVIGGPGSTSGAFHASLLVGLTANYVGFLAPKLALGSNILLMALILLWRPRGLFPLAEHH